jgi:hypothetical protein
MGSFLIIVGSIGAGLAGIVGQLTTFRDSNHRVTTRARWVLTSVVVSTTLTLLGGWITDQDSAKSSQQRQEDLLRTIWNQGNSIAAADVTVRMTYVLSGEPTGELPAILSNNWDMWLRAVPATAPPSKPANLWQSKPILDRSHLNLMADNQSLSVKVWASTAGPDIRQVSRFYDFSGEMGEFRHLTDFNGAFLELHLVGRTQSLSGNNIVEELTNYDKKLKEQFQSELDDEFRKEYVVVEGGDFRFITLPVSAHAEVLVRNRPVASLAGTLVRVWEHDEDIGDRIIIKFPIEKLSSQAFGTFTPAPRSMSAPPSSVEVAERIIGYVLVLVLLCTSTTMLVTRNITPATSAAATPLLASSGSSDPPRPPAAAPPGARESAPGASPR